MTVPLVDERGGRPVKRGRRLLLNVLGNFAARAVNLFTAFLVVPLAVSGLGAQDYGIFAVILSSATFVAYADFGMGLAMVNPITASEARGDHAATQAVISQTWSLLLLIAGAVLLIGSVVVAITGQLLASNVALLPWYVFVACVTISLPAAMIQRLLFALERNYEANLWQSVGKVISLGGVFAAYQAHAGLAWYVFAMVGLPGLVGWINTGWIFRYNRRDLAPAFRPCLADAARLLPQGLHYTVMQLGPFVETGFDIILVGLFLGAETTASYDLLTRAFNYVLALAIIGVMPLWPAISAARAKGDERWARKIEKLSTLAVIVATLMPSTVLVIFYSQIIKLWSGLDVSFPFIIVLCLAISSISASVAALKHSVIMSREGAARLYVFQLIYIILLMPLKIIFLDLFGIAGLAIAMAALSVPRIALLEYVFNTSRGKANAV